MERTPADLILFGMGWLGFLTTAAGIMGMSPPIALTGAILFGLVLLCFLVKQLLSD